MNEAIEEFLQSAQPGEETVVDIEDGDVVKQFRISRVDSAPEEAAA